MLERNRRSLPALTIARYTIRGYIKERVLLVVLIFAFVLMVSGYVLAPLAVGAQQKIITDIGLASISIFGILLVILLGASSYSREKQEGILSSILVKPINRVDFILGKYFGTTLTIAAVMFIMALVYLFVTFLGNASLSATMFLAMYLSVVEVALVMAFMTFFSSFTSPMLASFFTLFIFIAGHLSEDLLEFTRHFGGTAFKAIASVGFYTLPNLALFNIRSQAVHNLPLLEHYSLSVTVYALTYIAFLLFVSTMIFRRKDVM
jgi:ABC-type transport system involved in multi-copper enzyme maturation permease subunit